MENEEVDPGLDSVIDDEEIWYTDDPVADPKIDWYYKLRSFAPIAILLLVTTIYLPNTVGGKITLNSGAAAIEFGQSNPLLTACSGSENIDVKASATFQNENQTGKFLLNSITVKNIPSSCLGTEFTLSAYDNSSNSSLDIFETSTTKAVVQYLSSSLAVEGEKSFGLTLSSSPSSCTGCFEVIFDNPVGLATNVHKLVMTTGILTPASNRTWTSNTIESSTSRTYKSIAASSDGSTLAAVANGPNVYVSTNSGVTWTTRSTSPAMVAAKSVSSSSSGSVLAVVDGGPGYPWISKDSGFSWTRINNSQAAGGITTWSLIGASSDGTKLAALITGEYIYESTNSGSSWTRISPNVTYKRNWSSVALASNGSLQYASETNGFIYKSSNPTSSTALAWPSLTSAGSRNWTSLATSTEGQIVYAAASNDFIYRSLDSGVTWTPLVSGGSRNWSSITASSDGTRIAASVRGGYIYVSSNLGTTWTEQTNAGSKTWSSIASSADGKKLFAVEDGGTLWSSTLD